MTKQEYTNKRDLTYSKWHRTISPNCLTTDIDFIEAKRQKDGRVKIVAIIEDKTLFGEMTWFQKEIFSIVGSALKIRIFSVNHNCAEYPSDQQKWVFHVTEWQGVELPEGSTDSRLISIGEKTMNVGAYTIFIESLK